MPGMAIINAGAQQRDAATERCHLKEEMTETLTHENYNSRANKIRVLFLSTDETYPHTRMMMRGRGGNKIGDEM